MRIGLANRLLLLVFVEVAFSQTTHQVTVGDEGSFYDPPITSARKGDIVSFRWTGRFHSVTQSSFDAPCTPLQGGFDSSVVGNPPNATILPVWNLTITDDTIPIWFFCKATMPSFHCSAGMVGAINASPSGSDTSFDIFLQKAKAIVDTPKFPQSPPVLSGAGASANATPIPLNPNATATSSSSSSSPTTSSSTSSKATTTTSTSASSATAVPSNSGLTSGAKGGIAGGIVGAVALTLLVVLALLSYRRAVKYRREAMIANKMLRDKETESGFLHIGTPRGHRPAGSVTMTDATEPESSAAPNNLNVRELAAEIARTIRQENESESGYPRANTSSSIKSQARALPTPPVTAMPVRNPHNSDQTLPPYVGNSH